MTRPEALTTARSRQEAGILPVRYPDLHVSPAVTHATEQFRLHGGKLPERGAAKAGPITVYLRSLDGRHGLMGGPPQSRDRQTEHHTIDPDAFPESYFANQQANDVAFGHDPYEITPELRAEAITQLRIDQKATLETWAEYVNGIGADDQERYPAWFRYYVMNSVVGMGAYHHERKRFAARTPNSTAPFPDLNREALALVYDDVSRLANGTPARDIANAKGDPHYANLLQGANFATLYAEAVEQSRARNLELRSELRGEWVKYDQGTDEAGKDRARIMALSLQGWGTDWCTAAVGTAETYIATGDFYVYYTYDRDGNPNVPRIAIHMRETGISEVRGVDKNQEMEPALIDTAMAQVDALVPGSKYFEIAADMRRMAEIHRMHQEGDTLSKDDLRFIYEIDGRVRRFGYGEDPRITEIKATRKTKDDYAIMFDCTPAEVATSIRYYNHDTVVLLTDFVASSRSSRSSFPDSLRYISGYVSLNDKFTSLNNIEGIGGSLHAGNNLEDLGKVKRVGHDLEMRKSHVRTLGELEEVGGRLDASQSQLEDVGKLRRVGWELHIDHTSVTSLGNFEEAMVGYFSHTPLTDLGKLKRISFLIIKDTPLQKLGEYLTEIGQIDFGGTNVVDLGVVRVISGEAIFSGSKVTNLGKLQRIGGSAYFQESQVNDWGELEAVEGEELIGNEHMSRELASRLMGAEHDPEVTELPSVFLYEFEERDGLGYNIPRPRPDMPGYHFVRPTALARYQESLDEWQEIRKDAIAPPSGNAIGASIASSELSIYVFPPAQSEPLESRTSAESTIVFGAGHDLPSEVKEVPPQTPSIVFDDLDNNRDNDGHGLEF